MVFAIHQHESAMGAHVSCHPEPSSHLPPHSVRLGCPRAPALSALLHVLNLHWSSVLHMVIYMFQCYSLKSSHPHRLPQSPKSLFFTSVSILPPCIQDCHYHLLKFHIHMLYTIQSSNLLNLFVSSSACFIDYLIFST